MQTNPRKSLLRWSEFRKGSPKIPFEVILQEPSSLPAVEIIRNQSRYGRTLKRIGDIIFSLLVSTLGSNIYFNWNISKASQDVFIFKKSREKL